MHNTVLYIDDDSENLVGFELSFYQYYSVLTAHNTSEAYKLIQNHEVGVVLVDYKMPEENGIDFVNRVKSEFPHMVFVLISAWADLEVVITAMNTNSFFGFVQKPWNHNELLITLNNALSYYNTKVENSNLKNQLVAKNKELEHTVQREREANRVKNVFIKNLSHEIRTPLNGIIGFSNLIKSISIDSKVQAYNEIVMQSGFQLLKTIQNMLDVSLIFCNQVQISHSLLELKPLVTAAVEENLSLYGRDEIEIQNTVDEHISIKSDWQLVRRVIDVVIGNAIKFTSKGFVRIECNTNSDSVVLSVTDTGKGIDSDKMAQIFEAFRQADESNIRDYGGMGAGLFVAKSYVNYLGGKIWVESAEGKGSTFYIQLSSIAG